ncbi:serine O-acetyltransferase [Synechococcus sp. PCC 7336]|uniref:serine O-acetyltransferase n=1 Tax=Synechococcus sp. PCC 7336 TaxID=195250 RepID=UPI0003478F4D|nr:serine O-acetyltransferase [Synechococcus sp. PCC 7336]
MVDPVNYSDASGDRQTEVRGSNSKQPQPKRAIPRPRLRAWEQLLEDIDCVFDRDPAARNRLEVFFTYPGLHALLVYRLAHWMWQHKWCFLARYISFVARGLTLIEIHPAAKIGRRFFIDHGAGVVIGETAEIGDDVTLYHGVTLGGTSWDKGKRHPTLEDGVVIGTGAKVLGPITVAKGARVGANAVVVKDVPAEMSVVGIPGRVVLPIHCRRITEHGIDLDHHLMPDPVGKAISSLIERIDELEAELKSLKAGSDTVGDRPVESRDESSDSAANPSGNGVPNSTIDCF